MVTVKVEGGRKEDKRTGRKTGGGEGKGRRGQEKKDGRNTPFYGQATVRHPLPTHLQHDSAENDMKPAAPELLGSHLVGKHCSH